MVFYKLRRKEPTIIGCEHMTDNELKRSISDKMDAQINAELQPLNDKFAQLGQTLQQLTSDITELETDITELNAVATALKDNSADIKTDAAGLNTKVRELKTKADTWKSSAARLESEASASGFYAKVNGQGGNADGDRISFEKQISQQINILASHYKSLKEKLFQTIQKQGKPVLYETQASELKFRIKQLEHKLDLRRS